MKRVILNTGKVFIVLTAVFLLSCASGFADSLDTDYFLNFNGTNSSVVVADNESLDLTSAGGLTLEAWVYPGANDEQGFIMSKTDHASSGGYGMYWDSVTDRIAFYYGDRQKVWSSAVFTDEDTWVHCLITVDAQGKVKFYRNGVLAGSIAGGVTVTANDLNLLLGNRPGSGTESKTYFDGYIKNARVYNWTLTGAYAYARWGGAEIGAGLPLAYPTIYSAAYDELYGPTILDESPPDNDNNGTLYGVAWSGEYSNTTMQFNGAASYVEISDSESLDITTATGLTLEAWVKPYGPNEQGYVMAKTDKTSAGGYGMYWNGAGDRLWFYYGSSLRVASDAVFTDDGSAFVHCVITVDTAGKVKFYRNGVAAGGTAGGVTVTANDLDLLLGNRVDGSSSKTFFGGYGKNVCIYDTALSADEVLDKYNGAEIGDDLQLQYTGGYGSLVEDASPNEQNDLVIRGATWEGIEDEQNLVFDGIDDEGTCTDDASLDITTATGLTLEAWVIPDGADEQGFVMAKTDKTGAGGYSLYWDGVSDRLWFYYGSSQKVYSDAVFTDDGDAVHCAVKVTTDGKVKFYRNGVAAGGTAGGVTVTANDLDLVFGNRVDGEDSKTYFAGGIGAVGVYNRALDDHEIEDKSCGAEISDGLQLQYSGLGATIDDVSGNFNDGDLNGVYWIWNTDTGAKSLSFSGSDSNIEVADSESLDITTTTGLTLEAWIKPDSATEQGFVMAKTDKTSAGGYGMYWDGATSRLWFYYGTSQKVYSSAVFTDGETDWVHCVITVDDSGNLTFYRNGTAAGTASGVTLTANDLELLFGDRVDGGVDKTCFSGELMDARIYDSALGASSVLARYNRLEIANNLALVFPDGRGPIVSDNGGVNNGGMAASAWASDSYYADTGYLARKTFGFADEYGYLQYDYENSNFYGGGYGRVIGLQRASDGHYTHMLTWWASGTGDHVKKEEEYAGLAETTWVRTNWYYDTTYRMKKFLVHDGEAGIYFDEAGYKLQTFWDADGTICHWDSSSDYDQNKTAWYVNGIGKLEVYTYWSSGAGGVQYTNTYTWNGGTEEWDWESASERLNDATPPTNWFGTWWRERTQEEAGGADHYTTPAKPTRSDVSSLKGEGVELDNLADMPLSEEMERFFDKLDEIKDASTGEGVTVAILDSGINADGLDIDVRGGFDFSNNSSDYQDLMGHGTETAKVVSSTASGAGILAAKVFDENGETTSGVLSDAIRFAVDMGARVLAIPLNLFPVSKGLENAIEYAVGKDVILIAAAGNESSEILDKSFAAQGNVITVGSVDNDGKLSVWSNYGEEVDLYAPWDVIDNGQGTSFSAAFVAGVAALILEDTPDMTAADVLRELGELFSPLSTVDSPQIKGADLDEVIAKYEAIRKQREEFTGSSPVVEYVENPVK